MKIGITGTRYAPLQTQMEDVFAWLNHAVTHFRSIDEPLELHHGDCVATAAAVAKIAKELGIYVVCHPPLKSELRAYVESNDFRPPAGYFQRNRNIVQETGCLLVVPLQTSPQPTGGTWYTYNYAVKMGKPTRIFYPK